MAFRVVAGPDLSRYSNSRPSGPTESPKWRASYRFGQQIDEFTIVCRGEHHMRLRTVGCSDGLPEDRLPGRDSLHRIRRVVRGRQAGIQRLRRETRETRQLQRLSERASGGLIKGLR
jgi:hypothetical protein